MTEHTDPTKETFAAFRSRDRARPVHMLNLVRFRDKAAYPDGRSATGAEAYAAYGRNSHAVFSRLGGDKGWDECFIAECPSVAAFVEMVRVSVYREAVRHRQAAAVLDSPLIRLAPTARGSGSPGELANAACDRFPSPRGSKLAVPMVGVIPNRAGSGDTMCYGRVQKIGCVATTRIELTGSFTICGGR